MNQNIEENQPLNYTNFMNIHEIIMKNEKNQDEETILKIDAFSP